MGKQTSSTEKELSIVKGIGLEKLNPESDAVIFFTSGYALLDDIDDNQG